MGGDVLNYESMERGHGRAADSGQRALMATLACRFL